MLVLPAVSDEHVEVWGLVVNEAMSLGKPVITTYAVGSSFDLIENGVNGFMVKEKDIQELASKINLLLSDNNLRKKMGDSSKSKIEKYFSYKKEVEGFQKALSSLENGAKTQESKKPLKIAFVNIFYHPNPHKLYKFLKNQEAEVDCFFSSGGPSFPQKESSFKYFYSPIKKFNLPISPRIL